MIDPNNITDFDRSESELEEFLLFAVSVAGKTAEVQAGKLDRFLNLVPLNLKYSPFEKVRFLVLNSHCSLERVLREVKLGKYSLLTDSFRSLSFSDVDLRRVSYRELMSFPGIGPKTSRFFVLHSRPDASVACLDTHILKWLSKQLDIFEVPNSTPTGVKYKELEEKFIEISKSKNIHPAKLDLQIWRSFNNEDKKVPSAF